MAYFSIYPYSLADGISPIEKAPTYEEGVRISNLAWRVMNMEQEWLNRKTEDDEH